MIFEKYFFRKKRRLYCRIWTFGKIKKSIPLEAYNKEQVRELFKKHYVEHCIIKRIVSNSEMINELTDELMQKIKRSFEKTKGEINI